MGRASVVVSLLALGAAGWALFGAKAPTPEVAALREEVAVLQAVAGRLSNLEERLARLEAGATLPTATAAPLPALAEGSGGLAPAPRAAGGPAATPSPPEVLERRIAALEEQARRAEAEGGRARSVVRAAPERRFYGSVDDAAEDLDLAPRQRAEFERVIADFERDIGDLRRIPDNEGKTWEQVNKEAFQGTADGGFRMDFSKATAFRGKTVPGRSETFGEAEKRLRDNAKQQLRQALTPDQQAKFDKATTDPLLPHGGAASFITFGVAAPAIEVEGTGRK